MKIIVPCLTGLLLFTGKSFAGCAGVCLYKDSSCTNNYPNTQDTVYISSNQQYTMFASYNSCCNALFQYNNVQLVWYRNNIIIDTTSAADAYLSGANYITPFTVSAPGTYKVFFVCCQNVNQGCREITVMREKSAAPDIKPELTVHPDCNIYPNPSTDRTFNVSITGAYLFLEVYNSSGVKVHFKEEKGDGNVKITLPEYSRGVYIVKVVYDSSVLSRKVYLTSGGQ